MRPQDGTVRRSTLIDKSRMPGLPVGTTTGPMAFLEGSSADPRGVLAAVRLGGSFPRTWGLRLDADGQIENAREFSQLANNLVDLETLGDLDGNGYTDLAFLGPQSLHLQSLGSDLALLGRITIPAKSSKGLGSLGDLTGDGVPDLAVGLGALAQHDRVVLFGLDGLATAGFERRDALDNYLLENGRAIPRPHPGRTFVISSGGANLGAAIFDSTPGGPNAASQDPDLLVDTGNVLMLQDSLNGTQTVEGIYDRPNDDRDGGFLALEFPRLIRALSLELIDQDTGLGHGSTVKLTDASGKTRTYDIPPGFTEDRNVTGFGGVRTLRLDTLAPQPGYIATATASEMPGFADAQVVKLEVTLSGSGAIDDLVYDPFP